MARSVSSIVDSIFSTTDSYNHCYRRYDRRTGNPIQSDTKYMIIPIGDGTFEVPIFAFEEFCQAVLDPEAREHPSDALVVQLNYKESQSRYTSLNAVMGDVLNERFYDSRLCKITITKLATTYYGTYGALFNEEFKPIMMCSWLMEKCINPDNHVEYRFIKPIVRVEPYCFMNKGDILERFICNKFVTTVLEGLYHIPPSRRRYLGITSSNNYHPKIEIDECPFTISGADSPSVSTTNRELLQLARNHINEIIA